jgi:signal transduction histidine kinase
MDDGWRARLSLLSRGSSRQFAIGIALIVILPLLTFCYLATIGSWGVADVKVWHLAVLLLLAAIVVSGTMLLRRHPANIVRLRRSLEHMVHGEIPDKVGLVTTANDIQAIQKCLDLIVEDLRERIAVIEKERARLAEKVQQTEKMQSLTVLARGVAHDFNNLLAAVLGNTTIVMNHLPPDSPVRKNAEQIENTSLRALDLTRQILIYAGRGDYVLQEVNLSQLVTDMSPALERELPWNAELHCHLAETIPTVSADSTQMRQVVTNLVANAAEAITEGKGAIHITTGVMTCDSECLQSTCLGENLPEGRYCFVEVKDDGCGVAADARGRIFDPFFTTKLRGQGLGLAVVIGIIRSHRGTITIESEPDKGSSFRILLRARGETAP